MKIKYSTEILMSAEDTDSFSKLFEDFTKECKRQGLWARASVTVTPEVWSEDDEDPGSLIRLELLIDDSLRTKPGTKPKAGLMSLEEMAKLRAKGMKPDLIAEKAGISRATFYRRMMEYDHQQEEYEY